MFYQADMGIAFPLDFIVSKLTDGNNICALYDFHKSRTLGPF